MNEELIILGTGNATVTKCYNTCFVLKNENELFLVDTGGGNGILSQLEKAHLPLNQIHHIFISHEHTDHLLGIVWLIRMIATKMKQQTYQGNLTIYCHEELVDTIITITKLTIQQKFFNYIGNRILFCKVSDGITKEILGYGVTFFDINSSKAKQFGFVTNLHNGERLCFLGDEPYNPSEYIYANECDWLLHEAFCLYRDRDIYRPYEKHHATVKEACEVGSTLCAKNLILYHTEDKNIQNRKELYTEEGKAYYSGNLLIPNDLDIIRF